MPVFRSKQLALALSGSGAIAATSVALALAYQSPGCACGGVDTRGAHLSTLLYAQQGYHFERGKFADEEALSAQMSLPSLAQIGRNHAYRVEVLPETEASPEIALSYATPYQAYFLPQLGPIQGQKSYIYRSAVSALTFNPATERYESILCVSNEATDVPLAKPVYGRGKFICPANATAAR